MLAKNSVNSRQREVQCALMSSSHATFEFFFFLYIPAYTLATSEWLTEYLKRDNISSESSYSSSKLDSDSTFK